MADVNKIQLPDSSEYNIKDYRIPGVDTTPISGSNNVVTSGGVYTAIENNELVIATALNDLNDRLSDVENITIPTKVSDLENDSGFTSNTGTLTGVSFNGVDATVSNGVASITASVGDANIIETVKVNGSALTPDANKAVDVTVPAALWEAGTGGNGSIKLKSTDGTASGVYSISAGGYNNTASGNYSYAEGYGTEASGVASHSEGENTIASNDKEHAQGRYNVSNHVANSSFGNAGNTIHSIGIGTGTNSRKNAVEIMQNGDAYLYGVGSYNGTNYSSATTLQDVINGKDSLPSVSPSDNGKVLTVVSGDWAAATASGGTVTDVTVGGTSVVSNGTAVIPSIPTVPTNVSSFTNDANYVKYVLCANEAAYNAISNKDSGTLYLIPITS